MRLGLRKEKLVEDLDSFVRFSGDDSYLSFLGSTSNGS